MLGTYPFDANRFLPDYSKRSIFSECEFCDKVAKQLVIETLEYYFPFL
jgi:hypothetical protein